MVKERAEGRRYPRFIGGEANARIAAGYEASLLNISLGGALVEHAYLVHPGTVSSLVINVNGRAMKLRCRVVRSAVHRLEVQQDGQGDVIYHSGLEFLEPSGEAQQMISDCFQTMIIERGNPNFSSGLGRTTL